MIIIKTIIGIVIGISVIAIPLCLLYAIGRIAIPLLDPEWNRWGEPHPVLIMLAGVAAAASMLGIVTTLAIAYEVGEAVMHTIL